MVLPIHAVILERRNYGEADRLVTVFSLEQGRETLIAKGVRRPLSQLKAAVELFTFSSLLITESRSLPTIVEAKAIDGFVTLRGEISRVMVSHHLAEIVMRTTVEHDPNPTAFALLTSTLAHLDRSAQPRLTVEAFRLKHLAAIGLEPELSHCVKCLQPIVAGSHWFSAQAEGVECDTCRTPDALKLSTNVLKALRFLQASEYPTIDRLTMPDSDRRLLRDLTQRLVEVVSQRELKSTRFLDA